MAINEKKRAKLTGKGGDRRFLALPDHLTKSERWGNLSAHATKVIIELARQYNGKNNGDFSAPWSRVRRRGWKSKSTLWDAIREAQEAGFIKVTRQGGRHRVCTLYGITWKPIDECDGKLEHAAEKVASNEWQKTEIALAMRTSAFAMRTSDPEIEQKAA